MSKTAVFVPCFINKIEPEVGLKAVEILKKLNIDFIIPESQTCCGQPFFNSGFQNETIPFAKNFIKTFYKLDVEKIIFLSASCYGFVKNHYEDLKLKNNYLEKFKKIKEKLVDFYEFLDKNFENLKFKEDNRKVYLHPSCHLLREAKVYKNVINLLSKVNRLKIIEEEFPFCCGFGGTFSIKEPEISVEMAKRKFQMVKETDAEIMLIPDTSCFLHLNAYKEKNKVDIKIQNLIEYLYERFLF